ncbi:hypothetical protein [Herbiconiux ginsengi]|uniref:Uncharacterized protein n=1 Tax=Herbiconiux ginsengi TaxID=381665 RepID=A0A1H3MBT5_9MICO|nr:hypothetical protein [Herbiconiux ginsengi]SDY73758.1 hypothetical protein SAMN05216554_1344 [Herbiconiux ginsengi]
MSTADGDERTALHRSIVIWVGLLLLTVAALFSAIGILNREVYSASAFVRIYLDAVAHHDVDAALATPGVALTTNDTPGTGVAALVTPDALGDLADIEQLSDTEMAPGRHRIVYDYTLSGVGQNRAHGQSEFDVVQSGTSWLFFPEWRFVRSPVATATVTVSHASSFTAGRAAVETADPTAFHASQDYEVLVPSLYVLSHRSDYLGANPMAMAATAPKSTISAIVDVQPTTTFLDEVQTTVNGFLDDCAEQTALYPPGCPFGQDVNDRIASDPAWSIESYPTLTILAGQDSWIVPNAAGAAHITVEIRSLFDGTVSTLDATVPFDVTFSLSIQPDGSVQFAPRA